VVSCCWTVVLEGCSLHVQAGTDAAFHRRWLGVLVSGGASVRIGLQRVSCHSHLASKASPGGALDHLLPCWDIPSDSVMKVGAHVECDIQRQVVIISKGARHTIVHQLPGIFHRLCWPFQ